jgi:hypothetical protein
MNKGVIIEDGILAHDEDTLQALNFKRGIISALQVPILEKDEHINLVTKSFNDSITICFYLYNCIYCVICIYVST